MTETTHNIPVEQLAILAVEHWRLSSELAEQRNPSVNRSLRKIGDFLKACDIETRVLDGQPYDPGLAAHVVDTVIDPALPGQSAMIVQTICPLVLYRGNLLRSTDIVIAQKSV
jgi:hypothetical protein